MVDNNNNKGSNQPFTHTAYFFVRTAIIKGRVYGYWKDGGRGRPEGDGWVSKIDMLPRGGWDGRIRFIKSGDPLPESEHQAPQRPATAESDEEDSEFR